MPPIPGKPLIFYISSTYSSSGALLTKSDENGNECVIYYVSHSLVAYEINYRNIEKYCLTVVFSSQKLRHYMLSHMMHLIAKIDPLKYLLSKVALTRWLVN